MLIAIAVLFVLLRLLPGDPANALVSVGADAAQIEAARRQVGSDLPLAEQFVRFVAALARFDLGASFVSGVPVIEEIGRRLTVTLPLTLLAFVSAIALALPLGILAAVKRRRWYGGLISIASQLGIKQYRKYRKPELAEMIYQVATEQAGQTTETTNGGSPPDASAGKNLKRVRPRSSPRMTSPAVATPGR